ncbi:MAG: hypothetical protein JSV66_11255 [Trueperaceae bacterium]|nr:MAG: hypothetical protein JSV66_11255 [Trueperaceae bacterium]
MLTSPSQSATGRLFAQLWQVHAPLTLSALLTAAATLFFAAGIFLDDRIITGMPAWVKPTKFGISITLYTLTLTWMLGLVQGRRRLVNILAWTVITMFLVEWAAMLTQVVRGTSSHFNLTTPFDAALFSAMGIAISILWVANLVVAGLLLFQRVGSPSFAWAIRLGLLLTLVGMAEGFLMTNPTAQQLAGLQAGETVSIVGAHSVGVEDGGEGLPLVGWSTEGGDLRIGHFVGLHALQVLPFIGWLVSRRNRLSEPRRTGLVWTAGGAYLGLIALVTWQALRAQPLLSPDGLTLAALGTLIALTAIATFRFARRPVSVRLEPKRLKQT